MLKRFLSFLLRRQEWLVSYAIQRPGVASILASTVVVAKPRMSAEYLEGVREYLAMNGGVSPEEVVIIGMARIS